MDTSDETLKHSLRRRRATGAAAPRTVPAVRIVSGPAVSALVVFVLAFVMSLCMLLPGSEWASAATVTVASVLLALGWPGLTGTTVIVPAQIGIVLSGASSALVVALSRDMWTAALGLGLVVILIVGIEVVASPKPRDHSVGAAGTGPFTVGGMSRRASRALASSAEGSSWSNNSTSASLASSLTGALLACGGAAWVSLISNPQWAFVVPVAAVVVACVVWADQVGSTYRTQSLVALICALLAGAAVAAGLWWLSRSLDFMPTVLPSFTGGGNTLLAMAILGVVMGLAVGLAVIVIDGLLGDFDGVHSPWENSGRGAAKFLVAAIPVYVIMRVGGL